jgi:hypothetical protein
MPIVIMLLKKFWVLYGFVHFVAEIVDLDSGNWIFSEAKDIPKDSWSLTYLERR